MFQCLARAVIANALIGLVAPFVFSCALQAQTASSLDDSSCDVAQWTGYFGSTFSPIPKCFGTRLSMKIDIAYPGLVGIGQENGAAVAINDQIYLQRAQYLVQAKTLLDNRKQENGLGVNFLNRSGGGGLAQTNHSQKVALSVFHLAVPGAANGWAINTDIHVNSRVGNYSFYGREADHTNFNGDYSPGGCLKTCVVGQIDGNYFGDFMTFTGYPMTGGSVYSGRPNAGSYNLHYGLLFQAVPGFSTVGTGLIGDATINDSTNSRVSYKIYGVHHDVLNTIDSTVLRVINAKAGQSLCLQVGAGCISYDASNALMNINDSNLLVRSNGGIAAPSLPTSAGAVKGTVCSDIVGNLYVKITPGACM